MGKIFWAAFPSYCIMLGALDKRQPGNVIRIFADALGPNRQQAISKGHADSTTNILSHGCVIPKCHNNRLLLWRIGNIYHTKAIKQTLFERGREVGNPLVSLQLAGSSSDSDNNVRWIETHTLTHEMLRDLIKCRQQFLIMSFDQRNVIRNHWGPMTVWKYDVIKWKHFPRYRPFVRGIHRSPVNSPHKGQWRGSLVFSLMCALNKRLSKQSWGWWFETPPRSLWRHCNALRLLWAWHATLGAGTSVAGTTITWARFLSVTEQGLGRWARFNYLNYVV